MIDYQIAIAGAVVGFVVGLTGVGGGALLTPVLVLVFGIDPLTAVSSDLVASVVMKPIGGAVHLRRGTVNMRMVGWLVLGSIPAAFLSVVVLTHTARAADLDDVVRRLIGAALLLASLAMATRGVFSTRREAVATSAITVHPARTLAIGVFGGAMVGLTSVGSGSLMMVLLLLLYPQLTSAQLVGTDLVQSVPLVAAAAAGHLLFGEVQFAVAGSLLLGAVPAVWLGAQLSARAPDRWIRPLLPIVLVCTGLRTLGVPSPVVGGVGLALLAVVAVLALRRPAPEPSR